MFIRALRASSPLSRRRPSRRPVASSNARTQATPIPHRAEIVRLRDVPRVIRVNMDAARTGAALRDRRLDFRSRASGVGVARRS